MTRHQAYLLTAIVALSGFIPFYAAADNDTMVISSDDGTASKIALTSISKITFGEGTMIVATADGDKEFSLKSIDDITFDMVVTGIDDVTATLGEEITVEITNGLLTATSAPATTINASVYDVKGTIHISTTGNTTVTIDLASLQPGAYIVRVNDKTIKFIR